MRKVCPGFMKSKLVFHHISNYGDALNIVVFPHFLGDIDFIKYDEVQPGSTVFIGIGTLIGYIISKKIWQEWDYLGIVPICLGTGGIEYEDRIILKEGFVRGPLTASKTGLPAKGDPAMLLEDIWSARRQPDGSTLVIVDKSTLDVPNAKSLTATIDSIENIKQLYNEIAKASYIITDRLHVATTAESLGIPWVIYKHGRGDISKTPDKFLDWATPLRKMKFIVENRDDIGIIEENIDFNESTQQKVELRKCLNEIKKQHIFHRLSKN
jgi:hypothetical protein